MAKRTILAPVLILLGVYLILNQGGSLGPGTIFATFWPTLFVIPLGLFFHWLYFSMIGRGIGLLVPGGILLTAGIVSQIAMLFGNWSTMWPGFILAVAVGLFELYWFGGRNKWLLIPINILTVISLLFFSVMSIGTMLNSLSFVQPFVAIVLIMGGAWIIVGRKKRM
ncbi:hypothetical protein P4H27_22915 [Paenibacillus taichungensis]|jgi:hypothetical protein|uniref:DUF5668 domain-containing protein n=1 Tax=Paenibacillus taichungensis TaxID=484184 RepID=A0ABX2MJQ5_9BACL|nr:MULTISPECIES: hypothetical protein [Paenibacillus]OME85696.1 hypothetical protein BK122_02140 [Paenibacillus pabuli]MDR9747855.1 hypothetical protein [Paenibacillus taichungensis]MEC0109826.1 hypothetical protein [Paenibacillus taichungensis]MEC0199506.1 hypothetical protein [Paenibacillus taichungensis]NEU62606.1 hypothetical protein [Paenibacillus sp. ALJ109b]